MPKKTKWVVLTLLLLALLGGLSYYILNKKYYPKVKDVAYITLELANDSAQVKAGLQIQNRLPLPISIDSVHYVIQEDSTKLGWGQLTSPHTLPPLGSKVVDFNMLLDYEKYKQHVQQKQGKDSIRLAARINVLFDLPFISPQNITLERHLTVPVAKSPSIKIQDLIVRSFSVDSGYSLLLRINASNKDLPNLRVENFQYNINIDDSLTLNGEVDSTFHLQKGTKLLEIPIQLNTSDVIALVERKLTGDNTWNYDAHAEALIRTDHQLFDKIKLTVEKEGTLDMAKMGSGSSYKPSISQIREIEITSDEKETLLQAAVVIHNPAPLPFYIDSTSYFIRYNGNVIASGKKDYEKVLPKAGNQLLNLRLVVDESAYQQFMKNVQDQEKANLDVELNLLYNLPDAKNQTITLKRQVQVPVAGQGGVKVVGLTLEELDPEKGAYLNLKLEVQSTNLPNLTIRNLNYRLQLGEELLITGQTEKPIKVNEGDNIVEVPIHLSAEDVNQLSRKALQGSIDWHYDLQAKATLLSSNKMLGPTTLDLEFTGELEMAKGMGGQSLMPRISNIDSMNVNFHYDTAWVKMNVRVKNPLPVDIYIDSVALEITQDDNMFLVSREAVSKTLPGEGAQSGWITLAVNYRSWQDYVDQHQHQDSLKLKQAIALGYSIGKLSKQQVSFGNTFTIPMPDAPATKFKTVKLRGFSFTRGFLFDAIIDVKNANAKHITLSNITYNVCVENLLDVSGTIDSTYHINQGNSIIQAPISLGFGEVFRALFAKLSGNKKSRNIYLNGTATVTTDSPKLQDTFIKFEKWEKAVLFQKNKKEQQKGTQ